MPPIEGLSDEFAENETLQRFNSVDDLAKSFVETKAMVGNSIRIPGEDASDEARQEFHNTLVEKAPNLMLKPDFSNPEQSKEFYQSLGVPSNMDAYETPTIEVPEGVSIQDNAMEQFRGIAHKHNLTKEQFEGVVRDFMGGQIEAAKLDADKLSADQGALKEKWGMAYADRMDTVVAAAEATNAPEIVKHAAKEGTLSSEMAEWLHGISTQIGDEGVNFHRKQNASMSLTPDEARTQISEIMGNRQHPYFNPGDPGHSDAMKRMVKLNAAAAGEKFDEAEYDARMGFRG